MSGASGAKDAAETGGGGDDRQTKLARVVQFLTFVAMLDLLALALATQFVPPDRLTLAITVGPMLLVSPVLAYWFVYERGTADAR
ncbi:DUF7534 family protein [Halobaculum lipolyticum]|uniref:Uncharacterized protein n=1 Tax=Halobaculum lipolyticum TaxID=3032001 RepID=A0ABD5W9Z8_9EURY|nr:hypothetical protein [Halobaculum sp. DT31]